MDIPNYALNLEAEMCGMGTMHGNACDVQGYFRLVELGLTYLAMYQQDGNPKWELLAEFALVTAVKWKFTTHRYSRVIFDRDLCPWRQC